jgi:hypothetical protein
VVFHGEEFIPAQLRNVRLMGDEVLPKVPMSAQVLLRDGPKGAKISAETIRSSIKSTEALLVRAHEDRENSHKIQSSLLGLHCFPVFICFNLSLLEVSTLSNESDLQKRRTSSSPSLLRRRSSFKSLGLKAPSVLLADSRTQNYSLCRRNAVTERQLGIIDFNDLGNVSQSVCLILTAVFSEQGVVTCGQICWTTASSRDSDVQRQLQSTGFSF